MSHPLLPHYLEHLTQYRNLQVALYREVAKIVTLKPVDDRDFVPTESNILEQIKNYPDDFIHPPGAWVEPRQGVVLLDYMRWQFMFQGDTLSFFNDLKQDVRLEFSKYGDICMTDYSIAVYFETLPDQTPQICKIRQHLSGLLKQAVAHENLVDVEPLLWGSEHRFFLFSTLSVHSVHKR